MNATVSDNEYFELELQYKKDAITPQFAGNISAAMWTSNGYFQQKYEFDYDGLNRLTQADYGSDTVP